MIFEVMQMLFILKEKMFCSLKQDKDFKSLCYKINYSKYFESSNKAIYIEDD